MRREPVDPLTPEQEAELAALLAPERPEPTPSFRARMDAHVEDRFEREWQPSAPVAAPPARRRRRRFPLLPALAATCAAGVIAIGIGVGTGGGGGDGPSSGGAVSSSDLTAPSSGAGESAAGGGMAQELAPPTASAPERATGDGEFADGDSAAATPPPVGAAPPSPGRKVEQSSTLELGAPADRVDDVAQDVLGVVGRQGGIVDRSSISTDAEDGEARFELRIPAARLQPALAQLSRLPDAQVLSRIDDMLDVNQAYVSVQRKLTGAEAQRRGLLRALGNADTEDATERLRARLDEVERTIAELERSQRALDRRVDYSRVSLTVSAHEPGSTGDEDEGGAFTPGSALDDAGRVLSVTAGVVVLAAAALVPLALLAACAWPLGRALRRRRREHALDAAA